MNSKKDEIKVTLAFKTHNRWFYILRALPPNRIALYVRYKTVFLFRAKFACILISFFSYFSLFFNFSFLCNYAKRGNESTEITRRSDFSNLAILSLLLLHKLPGTSTCKLRLIRLWKRKCDCKLLPQKQQIRCEKSGDLSRGEQESRAFFMFFKS